MAQLSKSILNDQNSVFTVSTYLKGEYGTKGIYIGVPSVVNSNGVSRVLQMKLNREEKEKFRRSVAVIREMLKEVEL